MIMRILFLTLFCLTSIAKAELTSIGKSKICEAVELKVKDYDPHFTVEECTQSDFVIFSETPILHADVTEFELGFNTSSEYCSIRFFQSPTDYFVEINHCIFLI